MMMAHPPGGADGDDPGRRGEDLGRRHDGHDPTPEDDDDDWGEDWDGSEETNGSWIQWHVDTPQGPHLTRRK